jgi:hypothetical protein
VPFLWITRLPELPRQSARVSPESRPGTALPADHAAVGDVTMLASQFSANPQASLSGTSA